MPLLTAHGAYIRWFAELGLDDIPLVGGKNASLQKRLGTKEYKLVYDVGGGKMTRNVPVPAANRSRYVLADDGHLHPGPLGLSD